MANALLLVKAAALATDERSGAILGWLAAAILSPLLLIAVLLCALMSAAGNSLSIASLCLSDGPVPADMPAEYRTQIEDMQNALATLEGQIDPSLDASLVKAIFYALYFGTEGPADTSAFLDCFVGAANTEDIYKNLQTSLGISVTREQRQMADSVYALIDPSDLFIGADGFCSPVGKDWRKAVTSEFGWRTDPFTGRPGGHSGIDLAVPMETPIYAALPGTVVTAAYSRNGYGHYVILDHGDGLTTLYGHCSLLLVQVGQRVETGNVIALSGSTGRSTGPHLHFEVRLDGERKDPREYLP